MLKVTRMVDNTGMDEKMRNWHPDQDEVEAILAEMRPIISQMAEESEAECRAIAKKAESA